MTREQYESLKLEPLRGIARNRGLTGCSKMKKADLIEAMLRMDAAVAAAHAEKEKPEEKQPAAEPAEDRPAAAEKNENTVRPVQKKTTAAGGNADTAQSAQEKPTAAGENADTAQPAQEKPTAAGENMDTPQARAENSAPRRRGRPRKEQAEAVAPDASPQAGAESDGQADAVTEMSRQVRAENAPSEENEHHAEAAAESHRSSRGKKAAPEQKNQGRSPKEASQQKDQGRSPKAGAEQKSQGRNAKAANQRSRNGKPETASEQRNQGGRPENASEQRSHGRSQKGASEQKNQGRNAKAAAELRSQGGQAEAVAEHRSQDRHSGPMPEQNNPDSGTERKKASQQERNRKRQAGNARADQPMPKGGRRQGAGSRSGSAVRTGAEEVSGSAVMPFEAVSAEHPFENPVSAAVEAATAAQIEAAKAIAPDETAAAHIEATAAPIEAVAVSAPNKAAAASNEVTEAPAEAVSAATPLEATMAAAPVRGAEAQVVEAGATAQIEAATATATVKAAAAPIEEAAGPNAAGTATAPVKGVAGPAEAAKAAEPVKVAAAPIESGTDTAATEPVKSAAAAAPSEAASAAESAQTGTGASDSASPDMPASADTISTAAEPETSSEGRPSDESGSDAQHRTQTERPGQKQLYFTSNTSLTRGVLEVHQEGYGFLRGENFLSGDDDVYVSPAQIRRFNLKTGDMIEGIKREKGVGDKNGALLYVSTVNDFSPDQARRRPNFENMTPVFPYERIRLEQPGGSTATRVVDLISPIGKGQRGMIVSPPKAGKTTLLKDIAKSILTGDPEAHLIILLVDERPEEVTDMKESVTGKNVEVIYSTFDEQPEHHMRVAEMVIERARRLVEHKQDVIILLDSITRLTRAYNLLVPPSGRTLSGGLDPAALYAPKRFFGAARKMREGGSLTILATALVDTGSKMDDVVYEEFKGTGNMELILDRKLQERRIFPAIDITKSGTRREDLLLSPDELRAVYLMRRRMNGLKPEDAVENILNAFARSKSNEQVVNSVLTKWV